MVSSPDSEYTVWSSPARHRKQTSALVWIPAAITRVCSRFAPYILAVTIVMDTDVISDPDFFQDRALDLSFLGLFLSFPFFLERSGPNP